MRETTTTAPNGNQKNAPYPEMTGSLRPVAGPAVPKFRNSSLACNLIASIVISQDNPKASARYVATYLLRDAGAERQANPQLHFVKSS
jgi:hypothetical protein